MHIRYLIIIFITIAVIFITAILFYGGRTFFPGNLSLNNSVSIVTPSSAAMTLTSLDGSKIISYNDYKANPSPHESATIFTIKDLKTLRENKIPFIIPTENIGRYIEQWYWIDNQYVLISGDGFISILDTVRLKQTKKLIGYDPKLSQGGKILTYTEIIPPLYGPQSGKTEVKSVALP